MKHGENSLYLSEGVNIITVVLIRKQQHHVSYSCRGVQYETDSIRHHSFEYEGSDQSLWKLGKAKKEIHH